MDTGSKVRQCGSTTKMLFAIAGEGTCSQNSIRVVVASSVRDNQKNFLKYVNKERRTKDNIILLLDEDGHLANRDTCKAEMYNSLSSTLMVGSGIMTAVMQIAANPEITLDLLLHLDGA